ncbi:universal stress protein family-domain-containing protein [Chytriomyces cf. hyalinus JEL632]|nr:universal stress protein family-domain-containing protein [Chytriomyces cf. hyalinus JEL632]
MSSTNTASKPTEFNPSEELKRSEQQARAEGQQQSQQAEQQAQQQSQQAEQQQRSAEYQARQGEDTKNSSDAQSTQQRAEQIAKEGTSRSEGQGQQQEGQQQGLQGQQQQGQQQQGQQQQGQQQQQQGQQQRSGSKILLAMDEANHSIRALKFVLSKLVRSSEDIITTLFVIQNELEREATYARGKTLVSTVHDSYPADCKFAVQIAVSSSLGQVGPKICEVADTFQPDMLIVGSSGKSHLEGMMAGSVSNYVLSRASCPVVVVRLTTADETRLERKNQNPTLLTRNEPFKLS